MSNVDKTSLSEKRESAQVSTRVLESTSGWKFINWRELYDYRDLFFFLVWRDIKATYKQTVLGIGWAIIKPLFSTAVMVIIFSKLGNIATDGIPPPVYIFSGMLPWAYFAGSTSGAILSLIGSSRMISKVYFPRLIIPITPILSRLVDFCVGSVILVILMIIYDMTPSWNILSFPILLLIMTMTASGLGMWLSALAIQYRDVRQIATFMIQMLMYAAPIVWGYQLLDEAIVSLNILGGNVQLVHYIYGLYPMAGVIAGFRSALFGLTPMPWDLIMVGLASSSVMAFTGAMYFRKLERKFADVV